MKTLLLALTLFTQIACTGGGGSSSSSYQLDPTDYGNGNGDLNHIQLAKLFAQNLTVDSGSTFTYIISTTERYNYMIVHNTITDQLEAINIDLYDPETMNAADFYNSGTSIFRGLEFFDSYFEYTYTYELTGYDIHDNPVYEEVENSRFVPSKYVHQGTGLIFEKTTATAKDLAKVQSIKEAHLISNNAKNLAENFGLSLSRSKEIAKLSNHWSKVSKKGMTAKETDKFSAELLGFSISEGMNAYKDALAGDETGIKSLIEQAAKTNNITPEHAEQIMLTIF